ncbi:MauE/DoxX family redox-associated membrane protein [Streptosporangium sp. CA-135522]|uniref:MauE/DoxX family redox-associated membrane protein n=1 Tax=Streptosporangium sp. CA-135522 TaxID=3240072 RepID=UPI003D8C913A
MEYLEIGGRCLICLVFLVAAVSKVAGHDAFDVFTSSVRDMQLVRSGGVRRVALLVVAAEFCVCALMVIPVTGSGIAGFALAALLLTAFAVGIVRVSRRGVRAPCRCFGASAVPLGARHVVRNLALVAVAVSGIAAALSTEGVRLSGETAVAALGGLLLGGLVVMLDDVYTLFQSVDG